MHALTLHQPWAWAVAHAGKRVENRTWHPPRSLIGQYLAIHAGAQPRGRALAEFEYVREELGAPEIDALDFSAVVAVVRVTGALETPDVLTPQQRRWYMGPVAWLLDDVVTLPTPVPARGRQRLWRLDAERTAHVRLQWREAKGHKLSAEELERLALQDPRYH